MPSRLKSLELNGFKTFATKAKFEFADRITVVVGPNGSGKSNIADSLRWVLGEQSYRLLRGRKTDDMIFSGSEIRSRAGMASATITFDNSDGWLPIDFSEVSVTRRAYRDGQNEYLINNQKVRLKDVSELLIQSGLSERTYTVIGQGLVDAALSLKAEERRRLFEEAAGLGLYRARKEQAIKRLETTKRNLERVKDILAELSPRLNSLQRQAKRAEQYELVRADLRELMRDWYGYHWHRIQRELREARESVNVQEVQLGKAKNEQEEITEKINENRSAIQLLRSQINNWHTELSKLHSSREETSRGLAVGAERKRSIDDQITSLEKEIGVLSEEIAHQEVRLEQANEDLTRLESEAQESLNQVKICKDDLQKRFTERNAITREIDNLNASIEKTNQTIVELSAKRDALDDSVRKNQENKDSISVEINGVEKLLSGMQKELDQAISVLEKRRIEFENAEESLKEAESKVERIQKDKQSRKQDSAVLEAKLARVQAQYRVLQEADDSLTGLPNGAKLILSEAKNNNIRGAKGAISNFLDIPETYEKAIAAVLGNYIDAVIIEEKNGIEDALDLIEKKPARTSLLNLKDAKAKGSKNNPKGPGILGVASTLITAPNEYNKLVNALLGNVLVVDNRQTALHIGESTREEFRIVTLKGEVFDPEGGVLVNANESSVSLSRPREKRELKDTLEALEEELAQVDKELDNLDEKEAAITRDKNTAKEKRDSSRNALQEAENFERKSRNDLEQNERQIKWHQQRVTEIDKDILAGLDEIETIGKRSRELSNEINTFQETLKEKRQSLTELPVDEFRQQVSYWETQLAVREEMVENAKERFNERFHAIKDGQTKKQLVIQRQESLKNQIIILEDEMENLRSSEGNVGGEIERLQLLIDPAEQELADLEKIMEEQTAVDLQKRNSLSIVERHHSQTQIALARKQEAMDTLRQRIEDDLGLVAFEYEDEISGPTPLPFDGWVDKLPVIKDLALDLEQKLKQQRTQLRRMGAVNPEAQEEYREVKQRYEFLTTQSRDLHKAEEDIREVLDELDSLMEREFRTTFDIVAKEFKTIFTRLFNGGSANLVLTDADDMTNTGVDIEARLPGKRSQRLALLSGGERSLTATALVFALLKASPTPFCVMDEVDAMLDEANVGRFRDLLLELSSQTQFVVITHNRNTVQAADVIYGITMGRDTASRTISLKLDEVDERYTSAS